MLLSKPSAAVCCLSSSLLDLASPMAAQFFLLSVSCSCCTPQQRLDTEMGRQAAISYIPCNTWYGPEGLRVWQSCHTIEGITRYVIIDTMLLGSSSP